MNTWDLGVCKLARSYACSCSELRQAAVPPIPLLTVRPTIANSCVDMYFTAKSYGESVFFRLLQAIFGGHSILTTFISLPCIDLTPWLPTSFVKRMIDRLSRSQM